MSQLKRIELVIDLAKQEENNAAKQLAVIAEQLQAEVQRLNDLNDYYNAYKQNANAPSGRVSVQTLQNARYFLQQLDTAKQAQTHQINHVSAQKEQQQIQLQQKLMRRKMLEQWRERLKKDHQLLLDKKEQAMLDELTAVKFNRQT